RFCKILLVVFLAGPVVSGCGTSPGTAADFNPAKGTSDAPTQRRVNTVIAAEKPIEQLVVVTGTLAAEQDIVLGMKVAGRISDLPVDLGSIVQKGDLVAR